MPMIAKKLQGQVAIITGASRGIGAATAELLAMAGAGVVMIARDELLTEKAARLIRDKGGRAEAVAADLTDPDALEPIMEAVMDEFRRVDILVNNAGVIWPLDLVADADLDEWAYNIHVNLIAPFYLTRTVLPVMQAQGYGRILNISSGAATRPIPGWSAYCAAKAGLDMFTRATALEQQGTGVTVNGLYPGMVNTDMQEDIRSVDTADSQLDFGRFQQAFDQGQLTAPAEVARLIYWLVGPWSRDRNGDIFRAGDQEWIRQVHGDVPAYPPRPS